MKGSPAMEFTGERYVPEKGWATIAYEHLSRYLFASDFARGKRVLDLGSGEGYGAHILSKAAASVVGIDIEVEAVRHARDKYANKSGNLSYAPGSATRIPFEDGRFEVVVCFEMLEHIDEHEAMINEIRRVLCDDGILIVSTPDKKVYSDLPGYANEYHVRELYLEEFRTLLCGHFPHVAFFGQKNLTGNLIARLDEAGSQSIVIRRIRRANELNEFETVEPDPSDRMYFIAVGCRSKAVFDAFPGQLVADRDERMAMEPGEFGHRRLLEAAKEKHDIEERLKTSWSSRQQADDLARELIHEVERQHVIEQAGVEPEQHEYDLVMPNFNSKGFVEKCLDSLLRTTDHRHRIIIVDDASTDPEVGPMLRGYAERWSHIRYIRLNVNMGFPGAVNTGIAASDRDIVVVNSDTEFTPGWLARMDRCRRSDPRIHIVSPLSNNATICSVPQMNMKNLLKPGVTADDMARLVAGTSLRRYPKVPTAVGFCMLVTREVIDDVGVIDMAFGRGYGEEVDWCQRAWAMGYRSALCDDAFVFHHGEVGHSEFPEKRRLQEENEKMVGRRWPRYHESVKIYCLLNPLRYQHQRLAAQLRQRRETGKLRVLHVVHSFEPKAGTELHTRRIIEENAGRIECSVLYPRIMEPWYDALTEEEEGGVFKIKMNLNMVPIENTLKGSAVSLRSRMVERFFSETVLGSRADIVHFQHLQNFGSFQLPQIARALHRQVVMTLHDYFLLCPDWNMTLPDGPYCGKARAENEPDCIRCLASRHKAIRPDLPFDFGRFIEERNHLVREALEACDVLIAPSDFVKKQFVRAHGEEVGGKIRVIPHGTEPYPFDATYKPGKRLRVAFVGNMTQAKGRDVFFEVARRLRNRPIRFRVHGGTPSGTNATSRKNLEFMGTYERTDLPRLLQEADVVVIPPVWHETYCYTVDEAFRAGVPVIASRAGAIEERIRDGETGILVEMNDADGLEAAILKVESRREILATFRKNISKLRLKTDRANMAEYASLYESLRGAKLYRGDLIAERMKANRTNSVPRQVTMEEYCLRHKMKNPLAEP
ncbi:MAG: glycosyltransferase [Deltaproteobacteria bacterium]|nr:glycosyltransferase [Deltaproteobacteria bacterium]